MEWCAHAHQFQCSFIAHDKQHIGGNVGIYNNRILRSVPRKANGLAATTKIRLHSIQLVNPIEFIKPIKLEVRF